jgi:NAD(P)-dependent dehydrogenase (short-subunit alcohol dehydrogenase family)
MALTSLFPFLRPVPLEGLSVAVTGGAGGLGRAVATEFSSHGAKVALGDLVEADAVAVAAEVGEHATGYTVDVSDESSYSRFLDAAEEQNGPLDILVHAAGVDWMGSFVDGSEEISAREVAVNLMGPVNGARQALRRMLPRRRGHIVIVSSMSGRIPQPGSAVYAATKYGAVGLTETLAMENRGSGVHFSLVHPGYMETNMSLGTRRPSLLVPAATAEECGRDIRVAVQHRRFNVWSPSSGRIAAYLGPLVGRRIRDAAVRITGSGKIADNVNNATRDTYYRKVFGGSLLRGAATSNRSRDKRVSHGSNH